MRRSARLHCAAAPATTAKSGELRLVFQLTDFDGLQADAWIEDVKTGLGALVRDHSAWRRFALVTDVEWVASAFRLFTWMTPGEVRIFSLDALDEAKPGSQVRRRLDDYV